MLNGSRNTKSHIQFRGNNLSSLANLTRNHSLWAWGISCHLEYVKFHSETLFTNTDPSRLLLKYPWIRPIIAFNWIKFDALSSSCLHKKKRDGGMAQSVLHYWWSCLIVYWNYIEVIDILKYYLRVTWRSLGTYPASTAARVAPTAGKN